jgi:hypothetical protein
LKLGLLVVEAASSDEAQVRSKKASIPGRPCFRHALYAPRYTYAAMSLRGVREAAEAGDWNPARRQAERLAERLAAVAEAGLSRIRCHSLPISAIASRIVCKDAPSGCQMPMAK